MGGGREGGEGGNGPPGDLESKGGRGAGGRESPDGEGESRSAEGVTVLDERGNGAGGESLGREAGNSSSAGTEERLGVLEGDDSLT